MTEGHRVRGQLRTLSRGRGRGNTEHTTPGGMVNRRLTVLVVDEAHGI